jgi:hypothetical protein
LSFRERIIKDLGGEMMSGGRKPKRIIGKRTRVVVGEEVPKEDDDSTVLGEDTLVHVRPEELEEGTQVIGEQVTLVIGDPKPAELIKAAMKKSQEVDPVRSKDIVELGRSALTAQDKPTFKARLGAFIEKCRDWAPLATLVLELVKVYNGL